MSTDPVFVPDLVAVVSRHGVGDQVQVRVVHTTEEVGFAVQVVAPGGHLGSHHHNVRWDHFVALRGTAMLYLSDPAYSCRGRRLTPGSFLAVPPGVVHRVDNTEGSEPFIYLLAQAPHRPDDFHDEPADEQSGQEA